MNTPKEHDELFVWIKMGINLWIKSPTYERYILGPTIVNWHVLGIQKIMLAILTFLPRAYFTDQNPCGEGVPDKILKTKMKKLKLLEMLLRSLSFDQQ